MFWVFFCPKECKKSNSSFIWQSFSHFPKSPLSYLSNIKKCQDVIIIFFFWLFLTFYRSGYCQHVSIFTNNLLQLAFQNWSCGCKRSERVPCSEFMPLLVWQRELVDKTEHFSDAPSIKGFRLKLSISFLGNAFEARVWWLRE